MKPLVYVAGPYTKPDPVVNTHETLQFATALYDDGFVIPYVPHLSLLWHMVTPKPYEFWLQLDLEVIDHCQGLIRLNGESSGADGEVQYASNLGIAVIMQGGLGGPGLREIVNGWARNYASWTSGR